MQTYLKLIWQVEVCTEANTSGDYSKYINEWNIPSCLCPHLQPLPLSQCLHTVESLVLSPDRFCLESLFGQVSVQHGCSTHRNSHISFFLEFWALQFKHVEIRSVGTSNNMDFLRETVHRTRTDKDLPLMVIPKDSSISQSEQTSSESEEMSTRSTSTLGAISANHSRKEEIYLIGRDLLRPLQTTTKIQRQKP